MILLLDLREECNHALVGGTIVPHLDRAGKEDLSGGRHILDQPLAVGSVGVAGGVAEKANRDRTVLAVVSHGLAVETPENIAVNLCP